MTLLCCMFTSITLVYGQNILPAQKLRVHTVLPPTTSATMAEISPSQLQSFLATATLSCTYMVTLAETSGIAQIQVKLGHSAGAGDIIEKTFVFDGPASNNDGTTYRREGNTVWLGLGDFSNLGNYYAEVRLQDLNGNWTAATTYHKQ